MSRDALVVCIGNPSRGDDGAGARVADLLGASAPAGARVLAVHQLDVALAADVADARIVVFVDAERREGGVETLRVEPGGGAGTHSVRPEALLALAGALYGCAPPAWIVSVPASEMPHRGSLSARTEAACTDAASVVIALLDARG